MFCLSAGQVKASMAFPEERVCVCERERERERERQ